MWLPHVAFPFLFQRKMYFRITSSRMWCCHFIFSDRLRVCDVRVCMCSIWLLNSTDWLPCQTPVHLRILWISFFVLDVGICRCFVDENFTLEIFCNFIFGKEKDLTKHWNSSIRHFSPVHPIRIYASLTLTSSTAENRIENIIFSFTFSCMMWTCLFDKHTHKHTSGVRCSVYVQVLWATDFD